MNIIKGKGNFICKGKVVPVQAMKTYRVSGGMDPLILKLGPRWRSVLNIMPSCFTPQKRISGSYSIGNWVSPRASLDMCKNKITSSCPCWDSNTGTSGPRKSTLAQPPVISYMNFILQPCKSNLLTAIEFIKKWPVLQLNPSTNECIKF